MSGCDKYKLTNFIFDNGLEGLGRYYSFYPAKVLSVENYPILKVNIPTLGIICNALKFQYPSGYKWGVKEPVPLEGESLIVWFMGGDVKNVMWTYSGWLNLSDIPEELKDTYTFGIITHNGVKIYINDVTGDIHIDTPGNISIDSAKQIVFNQGENLGMIKIQELTNKINNLVKELETLRSTFNSHTHSGVQSGPGTTAPTATPVSKAFTQFNKDDYENTKILQ